MQLLWGIGGMVVLLAIAFLLSNNRRAINPRTVFGALEIQFDLGVVRAAEEVTWDAAQQ